MADIQTATTDLTWHTEKRKVCDLLPWAPNPRMMTDKQAEDLRASIEGFNLVSIPAINIDNTIISGHQRMKVMALLGRGQEEIDVRVPNRTLTPEEVAELNLRENKNQGQFDFDLLANLDEELLLNVGFAPNELDNIFELNLVNQDPDETPAAPDQATAKLGDIYILGKHRVMCGDSTILGNVEALLRENDAILQPDMLFTDPPYNVDYAGEGKNTSEGIKNDNLSKEDFDVFINKVFENVYKVMRGGAVFYICSGWSSYPTFNEQLILNGFYRAGVIIWVKNNAAMGFNDFRYKHEWILVGKKKEVRIKAVSILYGWKKGSAHYFRSTRDEYDVWEVPREHIGEYKHPTQKPVWLIEKALANSSQRGQIVLDLFGGSGSTLVACERLNRRAFLMEYDPKYVDVIIARWEKYTGQKAIKIS